MLKCTDNANSFIIWTNIEFKTKTQLWNLKKSMVKNAQYPNIYKGIVQKLPFYRVVLFILLQPDLLENVQTLLHCSQT